jgi:hypothetical protein
METYTFDVYTSLMAATRDRRERLIREWIEAVKLGMKDNMDFWAKAIESNNDAAAFVFTHSTMIGESLIEQERRTR